MSIDAGYEEDAPFGEPEHPHRRIIDRFFDELAKGKLSRAAQELRALHDEGGSLCRTDLQPLAGLLDESALHRRRLDGKARSRVQQPASASLPDQQRLSATRAPLDGFGTVFPYQLAFRKRSRGRPRRVPQSQLQEPWDAFASGDEVKASEALSKLDTLGGTDLEILAGLLDDDPALQAHFPWRLVPKRPGPGKPKTLNTAERQFRAASIAAKARTPDKQAKKAIGEACDQTKLSRATVYKAEKAMGKNRKLRRQLG